MGSIMVAAPVPLSGPVPRAPRHSLLGVPGVRVPFEQRPDRWESGVNVWGYPEEVPRLWAECSTGTDRVKENGAASHPGGIFEPFVIYVPILCSARGNYEEIPPRARAVLDATESFGIELALVDGITGLGNPHLADANVVKPNGNTAVSARVAVSMLDDAVGQTGREGLLHLTPAVADAHPTLRIRDDEEDEPIYTTAGTPVSVGGGYIGAEAGGSGFGATSDWVFATGPVEAFVEEDPDWVPEDIADLLDRTNNDLIYRAEKRAVVQWDTALQVAVLCDWSL